MSREIQLKYKGNKCSSCGLSVEEMISRYGTFKRMTEFHHLDPAKKANNYDALIQRKLSGEQLDELDKCILLCRQCHGILHAQTIEAKFNCTLEIEGKKISQELTGQIVLDLQDKKMKFFSEQKNLLVTYQIKKGKSKPELIIGVEMDSDDFFSKLFQELKACKTFEIRDASGKKGMMRGTYLGNNEIEICHAMEFPFLEYEFENEKMKYWMRNGKVVSSDGTLLSDGSITSKLELIENA